MIKITLKWLFFGNFSKNLSKPLDYDLIKFNKSVIYLAVAISSIILFSVGKCLFDGGGDFLGRKGMVNVVERYS